MFDVLKELKQPFVEEMYDGMKRILLANLKSGELPDIIKGKENTEHWRSEFWCENKNLKCYSILNIKYSATHYFILFDKQTVKPTWVFCTQNPDSLESMTVITQCVLCYWMVLGGDSFTMDHFKRIRADHANQKEINRVCKIYKELIEHDGKVLDRTLDFFGKLDEEKRLREEEEREKQEAKLAKKSKSSPSLAKKVNLESKDELRKAKTAGKLERK